jgi:hypothetical protein
VERRGWGGILVFVGVFVSRAYPVVVIIPLVCMLKGGLAPQCDDY